MLMFVLDIHYLKTTTLGYVTSERTDLVYKLLHKLGWQSFDRFVHTWELIYEEFSIFFLKSIAPVPVLLGTPYFNSGSLDPSDYIQGVSPLKCVIERIRPFHMKRLFQFPRPKNVLYDSGKLNHLVHLLRDLRSKKHKCLIFTQVDWS